MFQRSEYVCKVLRNTHTKQNEHFRFIFLSVKRHIRILSKSSPYRFSGCMFHYTIFQDWTINTSWPAEKKITSKITKFSWLNHSIECTEYKIRVIFNLHPPKRGYFDPKVFSYNVTWILERIHKFISANLSVPK